MRKYLNNRSVHVAIFLALSFGLASKAIPCSMPSMMEMGKGQSMACCTEYCRMEVTPQAADMACKQSQTAFSSKDTVSSSKLLSNLTTAQFFSDLDQLQMLYGPLLDPTQDPNHLNHRFIENTFPQKVRSIKIYTLIQSFLI